MAMNPMQKKARTSFLLGMFLTLVITGLVIGFLVYQLMQITKEEESVIYKEVYVVSQDVKSGGAILGSVETKPVDSRLIPSNAVTMDDSAQYVNDTATAKIALSKGTVLTPEMVNTDGKQDTADVRLQEYNMLLLPKYLSVGDYIDVRLRLPSGEDYIVISKKLIEDTSTDAIWIKVAEEEILTMSNAIVEAYIMEGSLLYATTYSDAGMQNEATPTYVARNSVINLMNADPNIADTARRALAARYTEAARAQRDVINQSTNRYSEDALTNVEENLEEEIQKQQTARQEYIESLGIS